jgi:PAS domain S-box-containing protein
VSEHPQEHPDNNTRARGERALQASDDRFVTAFYASPIAMAITTVAEGRYVDVNDAFERQMGYPHDEICGRTSLELDVWPSPADREAMVGALMRHDTVRDQHAQFRTKSGRLITTLYSAGLITLDGRDCILAAIADITAQTLAEDALRESESKFRMLAETTPSGIFISRSDGTLCYFNPQVEAVTGYSSAELRSMKVWDIVHPDSMPIVRERAEARWRGEDVPPRYEFAIVTRNGDTRWIELTAKLIEFEGAPAILATAFDITETKRTEQQAKEHAALLQTLVANSPFGILVGGKDHRIRFANPAFQRIFGYEEHEIVGRDPDDLVGLAGEGEAVEISERVLGGEVVHTTTARRRKDGSRVDVELHAVPLTEGGEFMGCFGIYQDISERIESQSKLRTLRDRVWRVQDEERAHIARELHDDIAQRLALLTLQLAEAQEALRSAAPSLADQLETTRQLTEELCVDVERLSHRLHPSQLAFLGLNTALAIFCQQFARQNRMVIDVEQDDVANLSPETTACLYRVAQEAIRNAQRHSGCRHVRVSLSVSPEVVRLAITDEGRGFDSDGAPGGSGLGLMSMTERVSSVGGELSIRSQVGRGTRICATIPVARRESAVVNQ